MADLAGQFRRPFSEQVAAFRLRLGDLVPTSRWDDITRSAHDRAFMVAGAIKADLLADLGGAVDRAIAEGTGFEAFKRDFRAIVEKHGWHGWTGEGTPKGENWRMRVIYRTNMRTSYMAGRHAQLVEGGFKYWVYRHGGSLEPRIQHLGWDGLILPPDHPFWATHYPPNGWGCSCRVFGARSIAGAKRRGGKPGVALEDGWQKRDPKTGAPDGIDHAWDYAPGASVANTIRTMTAKTVNWPYALARAYMDDLPAELQDSFSTAYRDLPSLRESVRQYAQAAAEGRPVPPLRTMGRLTVAHRREIDAAIGQDLDNYHFALLPDTIRHALNQHGEGAGEEARGQIGLMARDFGVLPRVLNAPDRITDAGTSSPGRRILRFERRIGGRVYYVSMAVLGRRRRILGFQSMWIRRASVVPPT